MKKFIQRLIVVSFVIALLLLSGCGSDSKPSGSQGGEGEPGQGEKVYEIKFALDEPKNSTQDIYALKFKELVEEKSNGRLKLDIYYLGQLGDGTNQGELIQNGAIDFGFVSLGAIGNMIPEANIFSMPYVFPSDLVKAKRFLHESEVINKTIADSFEKKNLHVVDWLDAGFMQWTTSVRPIKSTEDMKGLNMRVMSAPIITAAYKSYGADPVSIAITELYSALQLKMAEGQVNAVEYIENMKYYEVQKYLSLGYSDFYVASLVFNKDFWEALPDDLQKVFDDSVQETRPYYAEEQMKLIDTAIKNLEGHGMEINTVDDNVIAEFRELAKGAVPAFYELGGDNAEEIYNEWMAEMEEYNN